MHEDAPDFATILEVLSRRGVEFIVVGGVCAVLLGAPVATFDLDIVHSRSQDNLNRLVAALGELDAHYREHKPGRLRPTIQSLATTGHHLLVTRFGPLDVLGSIGSGADYRTLESHIETIYLKDDRPIRILDLETLIDVKGQTAREKDQAMLTVLKAMYEEGKKHT